MDLRLAMICGTDIPVPECQLTIHQPTLEEISRIGEMDFFTGAQTLTLSKTMFVEDKNALASVSNFQIFMTIMQEKEAKDKKFAVMQVLTLLFPSYKPLVTPRSLILQGETQVIIDENNFEILQEALKKIFCSKNGPQDQQSFNPGNDQAREIAKKLMRGRERVAAQKNASNTSVFSQYISILSVGLQKSIQDLKKYTMFQLYDEIERYMLWVNYDIDLRSRLAGGKPDKEPENWMKDIHT